MNEILIADGDLRVSSFCLGCMQFSAMARQEEVNGLIDAFRDAGGTFFDTAHCYCFWLPSGAGSSEVMLGRYVRENACREEVVIASKGGHPAVPGYRAVERYLGPERVAADIDDSLGRLQTDVIDLYWLHRDDPRLEVGVILETLHAEVRRGRIRHYGASNWTSQRIREANAYAREHKLEGFVASQPRWSLLEYPALTQAERLHPGALLHLDAEDAAWHCASRLPVIPYGPTGNGFFANGGASPERHRTPENQARCERAEELARRKHASPNQIALAWLLSHPFPVIPILGTQNKEHLQDGLGASRIRLSASERDNLEGKRERPTAHR